MVSIGKSTNLWTYNYGGEYEDRAYSLIETRDGGYVIVGSTVLDNSTKCFLVKTDSNGILVWNRTYVKEVFTEAR